VIGELVRKEKIAQYAGVLTADAMRSQTLIYRQRVMYVFDTNHLHENRSCRYSSLIKLYIVTHFPSSNNTKSLLAPHPTAQIRLERLLFDKALRRVPWNAIGSSSSTNAAIVVKRGR